MEWTDEGIVLGVRRHGESSAIVELLTRGHGRHLGLVRGVAGAARRASRLLRDRGHSLARGRRAGVIARGLWRDPSGLAGAAVAGTRSASRHLRHAESHPR